MLCWLGLTLQAAGYRPVFSTAGFYELPATGREVYSMNLAWRLFKGSLSDSAFAVDYKDAEWKVVNLPDGLEYLPLDASGCANYQGEAWYRKHFRLDEELAGKKLFLHFEGIMGKSKIWVNGKLLTEHFGGYTPVIVDVTEAVKLNQENVIAVWADNSDDPMYPVGKLQDLLDFTYFGGIYRDCWLIAHEPVYITDANYENEVAGGGVFVSYDKVSDQYAEVNVKAHVRNEEKTARKLKLVYELRSRDEMLVVSESRELSLRADKAGYASVRFKVEKPMLWSPETPNLYYLDIFVKDAVSGKTVDGYRKRIGIRSIEFKQEKGLWINGKPYGKIMGTNRHQDFAVLGNAVPNILQWRDAKKLRDAGMKVIRTHYVIDPAFMDACDELGMFALVETPGWQFWNDDPIFGERVYSDIRNMIRIHRNHASLFFWEPVLNETRYPVEFARNAAQICKEEYPYPYSIASCDDAAEGDEYFDLLLRPTAVLKSGKTYFTREWGDNVDDWNSHNSNSRAARGWGEVPMLVQAAHYAQWYDKVYHQAPQIVGGCFWHSFDHQRGYHPDPFYGGMMDAFRQPKTSYYMFMSQREPERDDSMLAETGPMVYIAHEMTPFSPSDVTVYSNCEEVRLTVFKGGKQYTYKKTEGDRLFSPIINFKNAFDFMDCKKLARAGKHADCFILAEGLMGGKVVATFKRTPAWRSDRLRLRLDDEHTGVLANGSDAVVVIAEMVDANGTVKRLNNSYVRFRVEGEGRLMGDGVTGINPQQISWGSAAVLVCPTAKAGKIKVTASVEYPGSQRPMEGELVIETRPDAQKEIYDRNELEASSRVLVSYSTEQTGSSELEKENIRLKRELNQLRLKEVERQQTEFGVGIND